MFYNSNGKYIDVSSEAGEAFNKPIMGRGIATTDFDKDGDLDVLLVVNGGSPIIASNSIKTSDFDSETQSEMITNEELRSCPSFEKIDDEEGHRIVKSLYRLSMITYKIINKEDINPD